MNIHEENADDLCGNGTIIIDGLVVETVYYWLTVAPTPGRLIAEGSISGSEQLMRKVRRANAAKLAPGGRSGPDDPLRRRPQRGSMGKGREQLKRSLGRYAEILRRFIRFDLARTPH